MKVGLGTGERCGHEERIHGPGGTETTTVRQRDERYVNTSLHDLLNLAAFSCALSLRSPVPATGWLCRKSMGSTKNIGKIQGKNIKYI